MRLRFWRRPDDCELVEMLHFVFADDQDVLASHLVIDCSDMDVRLVADRQDEFLPHTVLRHPDLWFDGRWEDEPEFRKMLREPFMPRLESLT